MAYARSIDAKIAVLCRAQGYEPLAKERIIQDSEREEIIQAAKNGEIVFSIARRFKRDKDSIRVILGLSGVDMTNLNGKVGGPVPMKPRLDIGEKMKSLIEGGMSPTEARKTMNIPHRCAFESLAMVGGVNERSIEKHYKRK